MFHRSTASAAGTLFCATLALLAAGCGEPGSPQPPSLDLPIPVHNLAAQRVGDVVHLTWTATNRTTDHTAPKGQIITRICRIEGENPNAPCDRVADQRQKLGTAASYDDILPVNLTARTPALLTYYVELVNHAQKSAGRSNPAYTAEGAAPAALTGLTTSLRAEGVVLHWDSAHDSGCASCRIRIERVLEGVPHVSPPPAARLAISPMSPSPPPVRQTLVVPTAGNETANQAIDQSIQVDVTYQYRARRVQALMLAGHTIEVLGEESEPVSIQTRDIFPPAVPQDLVAVADDRSKAIDLSWSPDTLPANSETHLAGYIVYRREASENGQPQPISGPTPVSTPAFRDTHVQPGVAYAYSVSAIDQAGNESARSAEAEETLAPPQ
jgi:hypothetical protein